MDPGFEECGNDIESFSRAGNIGVSRYQTETHGLGGLRNMEVIKNGAKNDSSLHVGSASVCPPLGAGFLDRLRFQDGVEWGELFRIESELHDIEEDVASYLPAFDLAFSTHVLRDYPKVDFELEEALRVLECRLKDISGAFRCPSRDQMPLGGEVISKAVKSSKGIMAYRGLVTAAESVAAIYAGVLKVVLDPVSMTDAMKRAVEVAKLLDDVEKAVESLESEVNTLCAESERRIADVKSGLNNLH